MRRALVIVPVLVLGVLLPGLAEAGDSAPFVSPASTCLGVDHFPDDPVGDAPTLARFGVVVDPALGVEMLTVPLSGASGDQIGSGQIGPDGVGFAEVGVFSYGEHAVVDAFLTTPDGDVPLDPNTFAPGGIFVIDDNEPPCDIDVLGPPLVVATTTTTTTTIAPTTVPPESTTSTTTSSTAPVTSTASTEPPSTEPPSTAAVDDGDDSGGGGLLPGVLIGSGVLVIVAGGIALAGGAKNCDREREELASARRQLEATNETLEEALADFYGSSAELGALESDLAELEAAVSRGGSRVGSTEYFVVDHERLSDAEVDAHREYLRSMIEILERSVTADEARVKEWSDRFDVAAEKVRAASAALDTCEGRNTPTDPSGPSGPNGPSGPAGPGAPSGPGVVTPPDDASRPNVCEPGAERRVAGTPERLQQVVDFSIIVEIKEGSERKVGEANDLAWDLARLGADIDALGKALSTRGATRSVIGGLRGISSGSYVMGAGGLVKGTAEGVMASGATDVDIPLSAPDAIVEALEGLAKVTSMIAGKAGEWMKMHQLYEVRLTLFCQTIVATPYEISTCVDGQWQCRKIWQYDVGPLRRFGRPNRHLFTLNSKREQRQMHGQIRRSAAMAQGQVSKGLTERAAFDARHRPGACT